MIGRFPQVSTSWSITGGRLTESPFGAKEEKEIARQVSSTTKVSSYLRSAMRFREL
jgi:hypothetical protein